VFCVSFFFFFLQCFIYLFFFPLLFICTYNAWVISRLCLLLLPPTTSIPSRNYFALISNFLVERV
jgi:hypothetical protein